MKKFFSDFKKFISRGNIVDLAVAVVVGGAFSAIVTALTDKIIMPLVNWIIALIGGQNGLESAYTILSPGYTDGALDLSKSIYIDWGAFIAAILNFFIIAFTLFSVMKLVMTAQGYTSKKLKELPTRAERKQLKADGVNMKNTKEVILATAVLREKNKPVVVHKPTTDELLTAILEELRSQKKDPEEVKAVVEKAIEENKPKE